MPDDRILGALIGLANAAMGHEDLLTPAIDQLVCEALTSTLEQEPAIHALLSRIHDAKFDLVPDCKTCTHPCGRHSDFDMEMLQFETQTAQALKRQLINCLCRISQQDNLTAARQASLYQGLRAISEYRKDNSLRVFVDHMENL